MKMLELVALPSAVGTESDVRTISRSDAGSSLACIASRTMFFHD